MPTVPNTSRRRRKPAALAPTVRFDVFHNGSRVARAGMPGTAVVSVTLHWVRRDQERFPRGGSVPLEELGFHVGALDSNDPAWSRSVRWKTPALEVGDRVEVRLSRSQVLDPPSYEEKQRDRKRPQPPAEGDPARVTVGDVIAWPAPRGVHLAARNPRNGGPARLSPRDAAALAKALLRIAGRGRARRTSRAR